MKSVQTRSYFWSVFSCIQTEYGDLLRKYGPEKTPYLDTSRSVGNYNTVLALDNPELKRTPFFVFMKRGYCQTPNFLLLSQQARPKDLFEIFSIVRVLLFTSELPLQF